MPAPIILPQKRNPWELLLPNLVNTAMQGEIQNKFAMDRMERQAELDRTLPTKGQLRYRFKLTPQGLVRVDQLGGGQKIADPDIKSKPSGMSFKDYTKRKAYDFKIFQLKEDYKKKNADPKLTPEQKQALQLETHRKKKEIDREFLETPKERQERELQVKKDFHVWKSNFEKNQPEKPEKISKNQLRLLRESVANAESMIISNPTLEAVRPYVKYVNEYLNEDRYIYAWVEEKKWGGRKRGRAMRVDLPQGMTASDIKLIMRKENRPLNQVLKEYRLIE